MQRDSNRIIVDFLRDANSIEEQALLQLETASDVAGEPLLAQTLRDHLDETRLHAATTRRLLEERGGGPKNGHDGVMRGAGLAFALFAHAQRDTPGKLAAQMYAYEALEAAGYGLLMRFASAAGDGEVAEAARDIREDEIRAMERIARLLDVTASASLPEGEQLLLDRMRGYLADAHALEIQSIELLHAGTQLVDDPLWKAMLGDHLRQTERQRRLVEQRLDALGADRSLLNDAVLRIGGLSWSTYFRAQTATVPKFAAFMYAFEHLEAAGYAQLHHVAEIAGDLGTQIVVQQIMLEERRTASAFAHALDQVSEPTAVQGALEARGRNTAARATQRVPGSCDPGRALGG